MDNQRSPQRRCGPHSGRRPDRTARAGPPIPVPDRQGRAADLGGHRPRDRSAGDRRQGGCAASGSTATAVSSWAVARRTPTAGSATKWKTATPACPGRPTTRPRHRHDLEFASVGVTGGVVAAVPAVVDPSSSTTSGRSSRAAATAACPSAASPTASKLPALGSLRAKQRLRRPARSWKRCPERTPGVAGRTSGDCLAPRQERECRGGCTAGNQVRLAGTKPHRVPGAWQAESQGVRWTAGDG